LAMCLLGNLNCFCKLLNL